MNEDASQLQENFGAGFYLDYYLLVACSAYSSSFHHRLGLEVIVDGAPGSSAVGGSLAVGMFLHPSAWIDPLIAYQPIHVFL